MYEYYKKMHQLLKIPLKLPCVKHLIVEHLKFSLMIMAVHSKKKVFF